MISHPNNPEYKEIPKEITFVWVGKPIPEKYLETILELADAAKNLPSEQRFKITVLTDKDSHICGPLSKLTHLKNPDVSDYNVAELAGINVAHYDSLFTRMKNDPFWQTNDRAKKMETAIRRELCGVMNGAAASDLIRYTKLFFDGGYYFDTDTFLKKIKLKADTALHGIISNIKFAYRKITQGVEISGSQGGNDMIGACPRHPAIEKTIDLVLKNYALLDEEKHYAHKGTDMNSPHSKLTGMDGKRVGEGRRPTTIWASGPTAFATALQSFCEEYTHCSEHDVQSVSIQNNTIAGIEVASRSDLSWVVQKASQAVKKFTGFFASPNHALGLFGEKKPKAKASRKLFFPEETGIELASPKVAPRTHEGFTFVVTSPEPTPEPSPEATPQPSPAATPRKGLPFAQTFEYLSPTILSPAVSPRVFSSVTPSVQVPAARSIQLTLIPVSVPSSPLPSPREGSEEDLVETDEDSILQTAKGTRPNF